MDITVDLFIKLIGLVGGLIAIIRGLVDVFNRWRNRGRLEITIIRPEYYIRRWQTTDFWRDNNEQRALRLVGKVQETFTIVQFEIRNDYERPITLLRLQIDDWIFSDHIALRGPHPPSHDYRAFDLFSKEPVNLDTHILLQPHGVLGRRVEIVESSGHAIWDRSSVPEKSEFVLEVHTTIGVIRKPIFVGEEHNHDSKYATRWSEKELEYPYGVKKAQIHPGMNQEN